MKPEAEASGYLVVAGEKEMKIIWRRGAMADTIIWRRGAMADTIIWGKAQQAKRIISLVVMA